MHVHLTLICINFALLFGLMVRFEWELILRLFRPCLNRTDRHQTLLPANDANSRTNGPHFNTVSSKSSNHVEIGVINQSHSPPTSRKNTTTTTNTTTVPTNNETTISMETPQPQPIPDDIDKIGLDDAKVLYNESLDVSSGHSGHTSHTSGGGHLSSANTTNSSGTSFNKSGSNNTALSLVAEANENGKTSGGISSDDNMPIPVPCGSDGHGKFPSSHSSTVIDAEEAAKRPLKKQPRPTSIYTQNVESIDAIELVKVPTSTRTEIEEEKDIIHYPNEPGLYSFSYSAFCSFH